MGSSLGKNQFSKRETNGKVKGLEERATVSRNKTQEESKVNQKNKEGQGSVRNKP